MADERDTVAVRPQFLDCASERVHAPRKEHDLVSLKRRWTFMRQIEIGLE